MEDYESIALQGGCTWRWWAGVEDEMEKWDAEHEDEVAIQFLDTLVERAEKNGIKSDDLTAPEGRELNRPHIPWVGALKSPGIRHRKNEGTRTYRLYFSEVPVGENVLLASRLSWKCSKWEKKFTKTHQTRQIRDAVGIVEKHCRDEACTCRMIVIST